MSEIEYWKAAAIYLADCHAATASALADRTSSPRSERMRQQNICHYAKSILDGTWPEGERFLVGTQDVAKRLINTIHALEARK